MKLKPTILLVGEQAELIEGMIELEYPVQYSILRAATLDDFWQMFSLNTPQAMHSIFLGLSPSENEHVLHTLRDWSIEGSHVRNQLTIGIVSVDDASYQCERNDADFWLNTWPATSLQAKVFEIVECYKQVFPTIHEIIRQERYIMPMVQLV